MTKAICCDRCRSYEKPDRHGEDYRYKDPRGTSKTKNKKKDLCFDCVQDLKDWWKNND